jgi:hypothetical protein
MIGTPPLLRRRHAGEQKVSSVGVGQARQVRWLVWASGGRAVSRSRSTSTTPEQLGEAALVEVDHEPDRHRRQGS